MPAAFVQGKASKSFSGTSISVTLDSNVAVDSIIAVYSSWHGVVTVTASISHSGTATLSAWTERHNPTTLGTIGRAAMFYALVTGAGSLTVTMTFSATVNAKGISIHEMSGIDTAAPFDVSAMNGQENPGVGVDAVTSSPVTTTADGDYVFGANDNFRQNVSASTGTGFTGRLDQSGVKTEDEIQSSAGSIAATFTSPHVADDFITGIMAFKPAGGAATERHQTRHLRQASGFR